MISLVPATSQVRPASNWSSANCGTWKPMSQEPNRLMAVARHFVRQQHIQVIAPADLLCGLILWSGDHKPAVKQAAVVARNDGEKIRIIYRYGNTLYSHGNSLVQLGY